MITTQQYFLVALILFFWDGMEIIGQGLGFNPEKFETINSNAKVFMVFVATGLLYTVWPIVIIGRIILSVTKAINKK